MKTTKLKDQRGTPIWINKNNKTCETCRWWDNGDFIPKEKCDDCDKLDDDNSNGYSEWEANPDMVCTIPFDSQRIEQLEFEIEKLKAELKRLNLVYHKHQLRHAHKRTF